MRSQFSPLSLHNFPLNTNERSERFISYLQDVGFYKEREIAFPHKQAALMKIVREAWDAPAL